MIHQKMYIKELLRRFDMENAKTIDTGIATSTKLNIDESGTPVDEKKYRGMIGYFLYLTATCTIVYVVWDCVQDFSQVPKNHT